MGGEENDRHNDIRIVINLTNGRTCHTKSIYRMLSLKEETLCPYM
jgi:hypothetical protein